MKLMRAKHADRYRNSTQLRFGGYNALGVEGEICDMENLTSDYFPELASRAGRRHMDDLDEPNGMFAGDGLALVDGDTLRWDDGSVTRTVSLEELGDARTFAQLGDWLTVWPDRLALDMKTGTVRKLADSTRPEGLTLEYSSHAGEYSTRKNRIGMLGGEAIVYKPDFRAGDAVTISGNRVYPENNKTAVIREIYREDNRDWGLVFDDDTFVNVNIMRIAVSGAVAAGRYYIDIGCSDGLVRLDDVPACDGCSVFVRFREGTEDSYAYADIENILIMIAGEVTALSYTKIISAGTVPELSGTQYRTYDPDHFPAGATSYNWRETVVVARTVPALDVVFAHENRLFGAAGDTIHISKWGDPFNWNVFEGTAADSFTTETGTPGVFTGGISYGGYPRFFKEDYIFTLYGDYPSAYQLTERRLPGVMEGSAKSLAIGDGRLFYLSRKGPCVFAGGEPTMLSDAFGTARYKNGVGASDDLRYYLAMEDGDGAPHQFVYDIRRGLWMREDSAQAVDLCRYRGEIVRLGADGSLDVLGRPEEPDEEPVEWFAEFGDIAYGVPERKRVVKLMLRLALGEGCAVRVRIRYDGERDWRTVGQAAAPCKRSVLLPIVPRRHDHFRLRLEGTGDGRISSMTIVSETGSDR